MPHGTQQEWHPTLSQLEAFLLGKLDREGNKVVLAHLIRGCADCQQALAPLAQLMWYPDDAEPPLRHSAANYDDAIDRAFARLEPAAKRRLAGKWAPDTPSLLRSSGQGEIAWALCESLLEASWERRHEDHEAMVLLAAFAAMVAEAIDPATRGAAALADLQARALGELGNARRVANDPVKAEADLLRARKRAERGTGDALLLGRLLEFTAALRIDQRRFEEAELLLEWALQVYESQDSHLTGKVLTQKAHLCLVAARPEDAAGLLVRALSLLDSVREPRVAFITLHNLLDCYVQCGRFQEAWQLLWKTRKLYVPFGGRFHQLKLAWIEGRAAAGLGHTPFAERCFRKAREGFLAMNLPYPAALAALELGVLLLEKKRTREARELMEDTLDTFNALHVPREAIGAMILLNEAVQQEHLTIATLRQIAAELQKAER